jgi:hypothetical protein
VVFFSDQDRMAYMDLMKRFLNAYELLLIGRSLMTNHVHQLIVPPTVEALSLGVAGLTSHIPGCRTCSTGKRGTYGRAASTPSLWIPAASGKCQPM